MTNNVGLTFSVGDTVPQLQLVLRKTTRIGDTKHRFGLVVYIIHIDNEIVILYLI
jgi:hypothetical protein